MDLVKPQPAPVVAVSAALLKTTPVMLSPLAEEDARLQTPLPPNHHVFLNEEALEAALPADPVQAAICRAAAHAIAAVADGTFGPYAMLDTKVVKAVVEARCHPTLPTAASKLLPLVELATAVASIFKIEYPPDSTMSQKRVIKLNNSLLHIRQSSTALVTQGVNSTVNNMLQSPLSSSHSEGTYDHADSSSEASVAVDLLNTATIIKAIRHRLNPTSNPLDVACMKAGQSLAKVGNSAYGPYCLSLSTVGWAVAQQLKVVGKLANRDYGLLEFAASLPRGVFTLSWSGGDYTLSLNLHSLLLAHSTRPPESLKHPWTTTQHAQDDTAHTADTASNVHGSIASYHLLEAAINHIWPLTPSSSPEAHFNRVVALKLAKAVCEGDSQAALTTVHLAGLRLQRDASRGRVKLGRLVASLCPEVFDVQGNGCGNELVSLKVHTLLDPAAVQRLVAAQHATASDKALTAAALVTAQPATAIDSVSAVSIEFFPATAATLAPAAAATSPYAAATTLCPANAATPSSTTAATPSAATTATSLYSTLEAAINHIWPCQSGANRMAVFSRLVATALAKAVCEGDSHATLHTQQLVCLGLHGSTDHGRVKLKQLINSLCPDVFDVQKVSGSGHVVSLKVQSLLDHASVQELAATYANSGGSSLSEASASTSTISTAQQQFTATGPPCAAASELPFATAATLSAATCVTSSPSTSVMPSPATTAASLYAKLDAAIHHIWPCQSDASPQAVFNRVVATTLAKAVCDGDIHATLIKKQLRCLDLHGSTDQGRVKLKQLHASLCPDVFDVQKDRGHVHSVSLKVQTLLDQAAVQRLAGAWAHFVAYGSSVPSTATTSSATLPATAADSSCAADNEATPATAAVPCSSSRSSAAVSLTTEKVTGSLSWQPQVALHKYTVNQQAVTAALPNDAVQAAMCHAIVDVISAVTDGPLGPYALLEKDITPALIQKTTRWKSTPGPNTSMPPVEDVLQQCSNIFKIERLTKRNKSNKVIIKLQETMFHSEETSCVANTPDLIQSINQIWPGYDVQHAVSRTVATRLAGITTGPYGAHAMTISTLAAVAADVLQSSHDCGDSTPPSMVDILSLYPEVFGTRLIDTADGSGDIVVQLATSSLINAGVVLQPKSSASQPTFAGDPSHEANPQLQPLMPLTKPSQQDADQLRQISQPALRPLLPSEVTVTQEVLQEAIQQHWPQATCKAAQCRLLACKLAAAQHGEFGKHAMHVPELAQVLAEGSHDWGWLLGSERALDVLQLVAMHPAEFELVAPIQGRHYGVRLRVQGFADHLPAAYVHQLAGSNSAVCDEGLSQPATDGITVPDVGSDEDSDVSFNHETHFPVDASSSSVAVAPAPQTKLLASINSLFPSKSSNALSTACRRISMHLLKAFSSYGPYSSTLSTIGLKIKSIFKKKGKARGMPHRIHELAASLPQDLFSLSSSRGEYVLHLKVDSLLASGNMAPESDKVLLQHKAKASAAVQTPAMQAHHTNVTQASATAVAVALFSAEELLGCSATASTDASVASATADRPSATAAHAAMSSATVSSTTATATAAGASSSSSATASTSSTTTCIASAAAACGTSSATATRITTTSGTAGTAFDAAAVDKTSSPVAISAPVTPEQLHELIDTHMASMPGPRNRMRAVVAKWLVSSQDVGYGAYTMPVADVESRIMQSEELAALWQECCAQVAGQVDTTLEVLLRQKFFILLYGKQRMSLVHLNLPRFEKLLIAADAATSKQPS